jgi:hypothetical protein
MPNLAHHFQTRLPQSEMTCYWSELNNGRTTRDAFENINHVINNWLIEIDRFDPAITPDPTYEGYCRQLHQVADRIQEGLTLSGAVKRVEEQSRPYARANMPNPRPKPSQAGADQSNRLADISMYSNG